MNPDENYYDDNIFIRVKNTKTGQYNSSKESYSLFDLVSSTFTEEDILSEFKDSEDFEIVGYRVGI